MTGLREQAETAGSRQDCVDDLIGDIFNMVGSIGAEYQANGDKWGRGAGLGQGHP